MKDGTLILRGLPNAAVEVMLRDRGDEPPPPVFKGQLGVDGTLALSVPRADMVVLSPGCETGIVQFADDAELAEVTLLAKDAA